MPDSPDTDAPETQPVDASGEPAGTRPRLAYLEAMGIELWSRRDRIDDVDDVDAADIETADNPDDVAALTATPADSVANDQLPVSSKTEKPVEPASAGVAAAAVSATVSLPESADADDPAKDVGASKPAEIAAVTEKATESTGETETPVADVRENVTETDAGSVIAGADINALQALVKNCTACDLSKSRNNTVFGSGNPEADWMFVGEAPGANEDRQGEAFVGRAGKLLDSMLFALGLGRDDVFIANVLKCRPPSNRDPMGEEVRRCEPYLHRQIDLVQPKVIVAMGRFAAQALLRSTDSIGAMRGGKHSYLETGIPLIVTYHPAYLLRTPDQKAKVWQDLLLARRTIDGG